LNKRIDMVEHQLTLKVKDENGRPYNRAAFFNDRREMQCCGRLHRHIENFPIKFLAIK